MSFVSYAQNFEDVMLWRALKHVENGVYIDVGAQHPQIDSVSLAFYEHGWRGVHVEPNSHYAQMLRESRPDETVIQAAVSNNGAVLKFYEIMDTGLSTCDAEIAERHRASGFAVRETSVPCVTLENIFESCAGREIHWLKIDVEGLEGQVLQGWKPSTARPWVVVVESTLPLSQVESHNKWEKLILDLDYQFVYFDGLNRYYLSKTHPELKNAFRVSPNVFDGFVLSGTSTASFCSLVNNQLATREQELSIQGQRVQWLENEWNTAKARIDELNHQNHHLATREQEFSIQGQRVQWLENEWNNAKARIDELNHQNHHLRTIADGLNRELQAVYASRSWRLTMPLRKTSLLVKQSKHKVNSSVSMISIAPHRGAHFTLRHALAYVNNHPQIKASAIKLLARFPWLKARLRGLAQASTRMSMPIASLRDPISVKQINDEGDIQLMLHRAVNEWRLGKRIDE